MIHRALSCGFVARSVLACAPYICAPYIEVPDIGGRYGGAESIEIFLEILWGFWGCRKASEGAENGFSELR